MTTSSTSNSNTTPTRPHSARSTRRGTGILLGLFAAATFFSLQAHAAPLPPCVGTDPALEVGQDNCALTNPGSSFIVTNSSSVTIGYTNTFVTNNVNNYSTTLLALLNGSPVYSMTFLVPYSDPSLTSAITAADAILSGDGASFGSPLLLSSTSVLQSSIITPPATYTCQSAAATGATYLTAGQIVTTTTNFGPVTISSGDCHTDTFAVLPNQTDLNVNTDNPYMIPVTTITTNTYLDSQTYELAGTTGATPAPTPEPASLSLALTGLGALGWLRRRKTQR